MLTHPVCCATNVSLSIFQKVNKYDKIMPITYRCLCELYNINGVLILLRKTDLLYITCKGLKMDY